MARDTREQEARDAGDEVEERTGAEEATEERGGVSKEASESPEAGAEAVDGQRPEGEEGTRRGVPPDADLGDLDEEELVGMLRLMMLSRRFEERAAQSYQMGKIGGFCHLYVGQEAVAVGTLGAVRGDDYVITAYREHVQALVRGIDPGAVMAELYGRVDGCSKGMGGSMHLFDRSLNFMGGHGIVGAHLPLATGVGYAIRYGAEVGPEGGEVPDGDEVCLCLFGDSVVNIGSFHESFNMAAKWGLPVVFVCENNSYGMGTDIRRVAAVEELVDRACGYEGMHAATVDGMDVLATRAATDEAVRIAREERRPSFIEARCYRYMGHSMADPSHGTYRSKEEVEAQRGDHDPILTFLRRLQEAEVLTEEDYEAMDSEAIERVEAAAEFADGSPRPDPEQIYRYVYADEYPDIRRRDRWRAELEG